VKELGDRIGENLDEAALDTLERLYYAEATALQQLLPGVAEYLTVAHGLGLKTAIASSSTRTWVMEHLERFGIGGHFDAIVCREDVKKTKPDPELYQTALRRLAVQPNEAIALEDSSNGIRAAKSAGLYCVVVPNLLTADLDLTEADLRLLSLEAMSLPALLETVNAAKPS
jgi:HAD superfamily hydrolase (TIGR01509 family)